MNKKIAIIVACLLAVLVLSVIYFVASGKNDQKNFPGVGRGQNSSAELSSACQGKNEGDSCEAVSPRNKDKQAGTCKKMGNSAQLVCLPDNMPVRPSGDVNN